jgi:hypothetical protein
MRKKTVALAAEVRRLRREVEGLRSEVNLWRTRYFELVAGSGRNLKPGAREDAALFSHPAIRESIEAADRDFRNRGGIPLEEMLRRLKTVRGESPASVGWSFSASAGRKSVLNLRSGGSQRRESSRSSRLGVKPGLPIGDVSCGICDRGIFSVFPAKTNPTRLLPRMEAVRNEHIALGGIKMDEKHFLVMEDHLRRIELRLTDLREEIKIRLEYLERKAEIAIGIHERLAAAEATIRERDAIKKHSGTS